MKIYESGKSVCKDILGYKDNKNRNYVCVLDNQTQPIEEAFIEMRKNLYEQGIKSEDLEKLTICTEKDTYTLAHERAFNRKGNIILTTSNLLRHLFTRNFSIDTLYYNEEHELIDMMDATQDVVNQRLRSVLPYDTIISYDTNILLETMYLRLCKNWRLTDTIDTFWHYLPKTVKPIAGDNIWFNKILESTSVNNLVSIINNYEGLHRFFFIKSGMTITALFKPNDKYIKEQEQAFALMLAQPPKSQAPPKAEPREEVRITSGKPLGSIKPGQSKRTPQPSSKSHPYIPLSDEDIQFPRRTKLDPASTGNVTTSNGYWATVNDGVTNAGSVQDPIAKIYADIDLALQKNLLIQKLDTQRVRTNEMSTEQSKYFH